MRIHHVALRTDDLARLEGFYAGVLGLAISRRDDARGSLWLRAGDALVMLERSDENEPRVPPPQRFNEGNSCVPGALPMDLIAFAIADRDAWRARLEDAGIPIEAETAHTFYVRDPDGRRIGLSTYALPTTGPTT